MASPVTFFSSVNNSTRNPYYNPSMISNAYPNPNNSPPPPLAYVNNVHPNPQPNGTENPSQAGNIQDTPVISPPNPAPASFPHPNGNPNMIWTSSNPNPAAMQNKSFADLFTQTSSIQQPNVFPVVPLTTHKGTPSVKLTKEAIDQLARPFKWTLVGKFSHGRPSMEDTRIAFAKLQLKGVYKLGHLDSKHLLIQLSNEADYQRLWMKEVWYIIKFPMRTLAWSPSWRPEQESPIVPVWVGLPGLPVHLFNKSFLFSLAQAIGIPLSLDKATAELSRPSIAKILVQVDVQKKLPAEVFVDCGDVCPSFYQKIEYDKLPAYCKHCLTLGHDVGHCKRVNPVVAAKSKEPVHDSKKDGKEQVEKSDIPNVVPNTAHTKEVPAKKIFIAKRGKPIEEAVNKELQVACEKVVHASSSNASKGNNEEIVLANIAAHMANEITQEKVDVVEIDESQADPTPIDKLNLSPRTNLVGNQYVTERAGSTPFNGTQSGIDDEGFTQVISRRNRSKSSSPPS